MLDQAPRQVRQGGAMFGGGQGVARDVQLRQPGLWQVAAANLGVVDDVAGDVGQLHRQPQVAGTVQHGGVAHAHDPRHHQTHHAGHRVAVAQGVLQRVVTLAGDVLGKAFEQVERLLARDGVLAGDLAQGGEDRLADLGAPAGSVGLRLQLEQALPGLVRREGDGGVAGLLAVDHVVAMPAPGIQQHRAAPGRRREQPRGGGETLRTHGNAAFSVGQ